MGASCDVAIVNVCRHLRRNRRFNCRIQAELSKAPAPWGGTGRKPQLLPVIPSAAERSRGISRLAITSGVVCLRTCPLSGSGVPVASAAAARAHSSRATPHLVSGSCSSPRVFGLDFLQTPPRDDALALLLPFGSFAFTWGGDSHPASRRSCPAHTSALTGRRESRVARLPAVRFRALFA